MMDTTDQPESFKDMSDEAQHAVAMAIDELSKMVHSIRKFIPFIWALLGGAFCLGAWVSTLEFRAQTQSEHKDTAQKQLHELEIWRAETSASRFTAADANRLMEAMHANLSAHDKRIQRTEDALLRIDTTLLKIEQKLDAPRAVPP